MVLALDLPEEVFAALEEFASEKDMPLGIAMELALTDWLIGQGRLKITQGLDADTPTEGTA